MKKDTIDSRFDTRDRPLLDTWDEIQRVQTDFCFAQELSAYYTSQAWLSHTRTVLDVGTGNGYFLGRLRELFPEKTYLGIDISSELIDRARFSAGNMSGMEFRVQDYFALTGLFDFVIMRLFWQHLPLASIEAALDHLAAITAPGSAVLITDAYDGARCFVPDLPELRRVIAAYSIQQNVSGRSREIVPLLLERVASDEKWQIGCDISIIIPSTITGYRRLFGRTYELWIQLFEILGQLKLDLAPVKRELAHWNQNDSSFTQAGIRIIRLDRNA